MRMNNATTHGPRKQIAFGNRSNGVVKVIHGANDDEFDIAGATVSQVYSNLKDAFNIPTDAIASVNGERIDGAYVLLANDSLEFCKEVGRKGINRMFTKGEILREYVSHPLDVLDELFARLRHHDTNTNGDPIWLESVVDHWLDEFYTHRRADDGRDMVIPSTEDSVQQWCNPASAIPPSEFAFGPLEGSQANLSWWLFGDQVQDHRRLHGKARRKIVWVKELHSRLYQVWFKTQKDFDLTVLRRNEKGRIDTGTHEGA